MVALSLAAFLFNLLLCYYTIVYFTHHMRLYNHSLKTESIASLLLISSLVITAISHITPKEDLVFGLYVSQFAIVLSPILIRASLSRLKRKDITIIPEISAFCLSVMWLFFKDITLRTIYFVAVVLAISVIAQASIILYQGIKYKKKCPEVKEIVNLFAITYDFVCMTVFLTAMFSDLLLKPAHSLGQIILRIGLVLCMIGVINIQYTRYKSKLIFLSSTLLNHLIFSFYHHHRESAKAAKLLENEFATALTILRLRIFFREKSPYLNPNISLGDVAKALGTDKLRISQSIKIHAGGNFRTFVNAYRIDYSMKAFKKDNNLKVYDLAYISGFKSTRAFIMAFRLFINLSPGEWCKLWQHYPTEAEAK